MNATKKVNNSGMGTMSVNKLLLKMAIPIMISMFVQAFYNMVDSYFVAKLGENALNAVSLAFPVQNFMISVSIGTGVGMNALLGKRMGQKKGDEVNNTAMNGLFLTLISYIVFAVLGFFAARKFFEMQTDIMQIVDYGESYLKICTVMSFGLFFQITLERILQSTGRTLHTILIQLFGAVVNIILDPILIFGLFGFPRLEVAGAALATVIGQIAAATLNLILNIRVNTDIKFKFKGFRPSIDIIKKIYSVGLPAIVMSSVSSFMVLGINQILMAYTATATAVFGVYYKLQSFVLMPIFGLTNGMLPIIAYNFGAKEKKRIIETIKLAAFYAVGIMLLGLLVFQVCAPSLLKAFEPDDTTGDFINIGTMALRIISIGFPISAFTLVVSSFFQAIGKGVLSLVMSLSRQLIFLLPIALVLSITGGLTSIWWAFPVTELIGIVLAVLLLKNTYKQTIQPLSNQTECKEVQYDA